MKTILSILLLISVATAQNYHLDGQALSSGGGHAQSANFDMESTLGEMVVGSASSPNYTMISGFWLGPDSSQAGGCLYFPGDINGNGSANGIDVVYGVSYFKGGAAPKDTCDCRPEVPSFPFYASGDVNGNCAFNGIDITYFVSYLKGIQPAILFCGTCPPAGFAAPPVPAVMPIATPALKLPKRITLGQ